MKKTCCIAVVAMLLASALALASNIQQVKASGTIYIRADGSIDPSTAPIQRDGDMYTLTGNINTDADGIVIERNNMLLDGADHIIQGEVFRGTGINMTGRNNVTIMNLRLQDCRWGIYVASSSNINLHGNDINNTFVNGIHLASSTDGQIVGNKINGTGGHCIDLSSSSNSIITENNLTRGYVGIWSTHSSGNNISKNNIVYSSWFDIELNWYSNYNRIFDNNLTNTNYGVFLYMYVDHNEIFCNTIANHYRDGIDLTRSSFNNIYCNNISDNDHGMSLLDSPNNLVYHNNFVDNTYQVYFISQTSTNIWDDGYPSGGNYWSDYGGPDLYGGPYQNETGSDGIGDTPYVMDSSNQDRYPLTEPWPPQLHELTVNSMPITGIAFTVDDVPYVTPHTATLPTGFHKLEMPQTYNGYVWSHWLEDGDTNRIKTISLHGTTWTGVYVQASPPTPPVGGEWIPINKLQLLAPWISLLSLMTVLTMSFVYIRRKRRQS